MRKILCNFFLLWPILAFSNPIDPGPPITISEIYFESDTTWKIELQCVADYHEIDSFKIESKSGRYLIPFNIPYFGYLILTPDSFDFVFGLDINGDYLKVITFQHDNSWLFDNEDSISWGDCPGSYLPNINYGQSIARDGYYFKDLFYKDNSPTIGFDNDMVDATGVIYGFWYDGQYNKVLNKSLYTRYGKITTDENGFYKTHLPSRKYYIDYGYSEYYDGYYSGFVQLTPILFNLEVDDSIQIDFLNKLVSVPEYSNPNKIILTNYPNPAENETNFVFDIPENISLQSVSFLIYDTMGKLIFNLPLKKFSNTFKFDCSNLPSGIYSYFIVQNNLPISKTGTLIIIH